MMRLLSATTASFALTNHHDLWWRLRLRRPHRSTSVAHLNRPTQRRRPIHILDTNRNDGAAVSGVPMTRGRTGSSVDSTARFASLISIADQYDGFILDQFGVLHDGQKALPGAVEAVEYLYQQAGKRLMILSNTSAPAAGALERLPNYGFRPEWFVGGAVTSGEEASKFLAAQQQQQPPPETSCRVLFWTWDDRRPNNPRVTAPPQTFLDRAGPHVTIANRIDQADWLVLHGSEIWNRGPDQPSVPLGTFIETGRTSDGVVDDLLRQCAALRIPMICANPDEQVVTPTGGVAYMPGGIARRYMELCDEVVSSSSSSSLPPVEHYVFGKPDPRHFRTCAAVLMGGAVGEEEEEEEKARTTITKDRIVHVGDSMHHDIVGATRAGLDTVLITSGIHAQELGVGTCFGETANDAALAALYQNHGGVRPTHVLPAFRL